MKEYVALSEEPKLVQTKLNQWRHTYHILILGFSATNVGNSIIHNVLLIRELKKEES